MIGGLLVFAVRRLVVRRLVVVVMVVMVLSVADLGRMRQ